MNINRDNYEAFFLLYVDNELSAADRKAVEEFTAQHTDLYDELLQLQEVVLTDEPVSFTDKSSLLRTEDSVEEKLLLLLDNELDPSSAKELEKILASDITLKRDWKILQQTKLDASEEIVFESKHLLYRKEKDNVVTGRFVRWAIAAALIGAGFFVGVKFTNTKTEKETAVTNQDINNNLATTDAKKGTGTITGKDTISIPQEHINELVNDDDAVNTASHATDKSPSQNFAKKEQQKNDVVNDNNIAAVVPSKNIKETGSQPLIANKENKEFEKISPERTNTTLAISVPKKREIIDVNIMEVPQNSNASTASLNEEPSDNHILYLNEEEVSRSKAGGFLRKLKRTVERKTKIKPGNGLKIAGFEIALN